MVGGWRKATILARCLDMISAQVMPTAVADQLPQRMDKTAMFCVGSPQKWETATTISCSRQGYTLVQVFEWMYCQRGAAASSSEVLLARSFDIRQVIGIHLSFCASCLAGWAR